MRLRSFIFTLLALFCAVNLFAQDLSQPSKKELFRRARDVLKTSLEERDYEKAGQALGYLQENIKDGAPLTVFEEYLIEMEMGRYEDGIRNYADQRRILLDSAYKPEKSMRNNEKDGLNNYLYSKFKDFKKEKADSMVALVDGSDISQESKDLYASMIYAELVIKVRVYNGYSGPVIFLDVADTTCADQFLTRAKEFVNRYPNSEHTRYLKGEIIPMVDNIVQQLRDFRKDPLKHKFYTGGLGVFAGMWAGFMVGEASDHLDTEMGSSFIAEVSLQIRRFSINAFWNYGFINSPRDYEYRWDKYEDESVGLTLGFTAFDSRYIKVEPFLGYGEYQFSSTEYSPVSSLFLLGCNADVRIFATRPRTIGGISFAMIARFKYMMQFGTYEDYMSNSYYDYEEDEYVYNENEIEASFVNFQFAFTLGFYIW